MAYALVYHRAVADLDLSRIPANVRSRIARAIESRLTTAPERFGTPLRATLRGFWKLRVGDYRVVFRIVGAEVRILAILHRRIAYDEASRRAR